MNCPPITRRQVIIMGTLVTIALIQVMGSYRLSDIGLSLFQVKLKPVKNIAQTTEFHEIKIGHQEPLINDKLKKSLNAASVNETIPKQNDNYDIHSSQVLKLTIVQPMPKICPCDQTKLGHCPSIHIAMFVTGAIESRHIYAAVKSVLMHRSTSLHFHFITDSRANTVLRSMLSTWLVPGILHDYYDIDQAWTSIFGGHKDSQPHCFKTLPLKLNLHQILPYGINGVIVIEPTSINNIDLVDLWSVTMSCKNHMITLCSWKCVSYCHNKTTDIRSTLENTLLWGAVGLNLDKMRSFAQGIPLTQAMEGVYKCRPNAIHDLYNALRNFSITTFPFPNLGMQPICVLNHSHISDHTFADACKTVQEYDGNYLRYATTKFCTKGIVPLVSRAPPVKKFCDLFRWEGVTHRRELPFLLGHSYSSDDNYDVTLVNHLDYDRLHMVERSLTNWNGPVSLAIQVSESQVQGVVDYVLGSKVLRERRNISYHLLFKIGPSYPINALRELGHRFVTTPYTFYGDIDYVSSWDMYETIKQDLMAVGNNIMSKTVIVIPAFETDTKDFEVPQSKSDVVKLILQDKMRQFHVNYFRQGQGATNYKKWNTAAEPYKIKWRNWYEPYCLLSTSVFTFEPLFVARFHDKSSHNVELHMAGFQFLVLHNCFIIHLPHKPNWQNMRNLQKCSKQWYTNWVMKKRGQYHYYKKDVHNSFKHR